MLRLCSYLYSAPICWCAACRKNKPLTGFSATMNPNKQHRAPSDFRSPDKCPILKCIRNYFGATDKLADSLRPLLNEYMAHSQSASLQASLHARNIWELLDWLRMSELNNLLGFESVVARCPKRVVSALTSFDKVLRSYEHLAKTRTLHALRELYRAIEARLWDINPMLMIS